MEDKVNSCSDPEFLEYEQEPVCSTYHDLMEQPGRGAATFSMPTESNLMRDTRGNWPCPKTYHDVGPSSISFKIPQGSYGSTQGSKPSADLFSNVSVEKIFSIQNVRDYGAGKSLPASSLGGLKGGFSMRKEPETPSKYSCDLEDRTTDRRSKRERNRDSAKKCRQRKKQFVQALQDEVNSLREELDSCKRELEMLKGSLLSKVEEQFDNLKNEVLTQARKIIDDDIGTPKLDELLNTLVVRHFISLDC